VKTYRRQRKQYLFATLLGVVGVINLLFFFILYGPARSEYYRQQESIERLRGDIEGRRQKIETLERLNSQLSTLEQDRQRLFTMHFIPRDAGWSEILPKLNAMVQETHVDNTQKAYTIDQAPQYGLYSVKIRVPVQGAYPSVVNFIKDIENSETFFVINGVDVHGSSLQGVSTSNIALDLNIETFFYQ
jgi:Tfp pilus assembly protein PilO